MPNFDPGTRKLATRASSELKISDPGYYLHPDSDPLNAVEFIVEDAEEALRRGATEEGLRLTFWTPFLLATTIGYDGFIVGSLAETLAANLQKSAGASANADPIRVGEALGIDRPDQYLNSGDASEAATDLWGLALRHVRSGPRPYGVKLAFWAAYLRATEFDSVAADFVEPLVGAAARFRAFANGRD